MKRVEIAEAIQSNRLDQVLRAAPALRDDPNMWLKKESWTVTPIFLAVDRACENAEEREQNFAIITYLLTIPNMKVSLDRQEDNFSCLAAAVYNNKVAVLSKLLTHLRYVEFKGNRTAFLKELNQVTQQTFPEYPDGTTALSWSILRLQPSLARLLIAVDPDSINILDADIARAEKLEEQLDYLVYDLKRTRREQEERRVQKGRMLSRYYQSKQKYERYNLWSEWAAQLLAFTTGALSILGVLVADVAVEPPQVVIAAFVSLVTWYFSRVKHEAETGRSEAVQFLISEKGFFDDPAEIDKAVETMDASVTT